MIVRTKQETKKIRNSLPNTSKCKEEDSRDLQRRRKSLTVMLHTARLSRFIGPGYYHPILQAKIPTSPPQDRRVKHRKITSDCE